MVQMNLIRNTNKYHKVNGQIYSAIDFLYRRHTNTVIE